jgi:P-type Ca2+ transporter type 2C
MENPLEKWHALELTELVRKLGADPVRGLSLQEANRRLREHGPNLLKERGLKSPWAILREQLTASMVLILIVAAVVSALLGDWKDTLAIGVIVVLNALLGFRQEYKAEQAVAALKSLAVPTVRVLREGAVEERSAQALVPGDVVLLEAGNIVPADGRLLESATLRVQEAALTGESEPVEKDWQSRPLADVPVSDRRNMVYMGTAVTYGRARAVVIETGMQTELGRIADLIQTVEEGATPLQKRLAHLGRILSVAALALVGVIFALGILRGGEIKEMFLIAVSMAVAAIPEGLPAVVTIALALGAQRMLKRRALIRKLPAVETLGSVTVICSDKTGTLTQNRMRATVAEVSEKEFNLDALLETLNPQGELTREPLAEEGERPMASLLLLLIGGALCGDAILRAEGEEAQGEPRAMGDPTETALVEVAVRFGLRKEAIEEILPRIAEVPFDSDRKRMSTIHTLPSPATERDKSIASLHRRIFELTGSPHLAFTKGAVDSLLQVCSRVFEGGRLVPLSDDRRERILSANDRLAREGMRVLGVAFRPLASLADLPGQDGIEEDLVYVGLFGITDPARGEVKEAIATCRAAGIRPVMITGDHPMTARRIARDLGMGEAESILTGEELGRLSVEELEKLVDTVSVYARVSPEHKLNIVKALQNRKHIVAMTGDGVNDAPALKKADIGVAMGVTGTDVAKEVADMVLLDDNFATVVAAVEEGRVIYDNIRKFMKYLLTTNSGEIWVMLLAPFLGMPLPLLPLQILWINLVTDGLPALALGLEPGEPDVMRRPPYRPNESILSQGIGRHIVWVGFVMGILPLATGYGYWREHAPHWQTMVFTVLTLSQMSHAMAIRSIRHSLFTIGLFSNKALLGAVLLTFVLQLAVVYVPVLQGFFRTMALSASELLLCIAVSSIIFWIVEAEKWFLRKKGTRSERV